MFSSRCSSAIISFFLEKNMTTAAVSSSTQPITAVTPCAWVSDICHKIYDVAMKIIQAIKDCFAGGANSLSETTVTSSQTSRNSSDAELVNTIRGHFIYSVPGVNTTTAISEFDVANLSRLLNLFTQIQSPTRKMDAFLSVLAASNSTNYTAREFYNALPEGTSSTLEASKRSLKSKILEVDAGRANSIGPVWADHIIMTDLRGATALLAVQNLRDALAATENSSR
jgi:hypothetical protein